MTQLLADWQGHEMRGFIWASRGAKGARRNAANRRRRSTTPRGRVTAESYIRGARGTKRSGAPGYRMEPPSGTPVVPGVPE